MYWYRKKHETSATPPRKRENRKTQTMENTVFQEDTLCAGDRSRWSADCLAAAQRAVRASQPVGFVAGYYDDVLTITDVSSYFLENLGYTYENFMQATGGSLKPLFYGENQSFLEPDRWPNIHGAGDGRLLTRDGLPMYARLYKEEAVDADGRPMWVLAAKVDWTQQNLTLVNSVIQSGLWYVDCDEAGNQLGIVFSHEFRTMLGFHDVLDFPNDFSVWEERIHPEDHARVMQLWNAAVADRTGNVKYEAEYRMQLRDGSYQWFRDSAESTRNVNGIVRRLVGVFINIDAEKQAELNAQRVKELSRENHMKDLLIQGTLKLVDHYALCDLANDRYNFYDMTPYEVYPRQGLYSNLVKRIGENFQLIAVGEDISEAFSPERIRAALQDPDDVYRFEYASKDEAVSKSISITPVTWKNGQVEQVLFVSQDTTQEKQTERQARMALKDAYDAANRANRAKTAFLSNMSHDIRTPMNAIVGMTAIAGANIENQERVLDCLGKITQASRHLLGLINEVLDMSRIESGKVVLTEEEFNLGELIDNLIAMAKSSIEEHHHAFEVRLETIEHEAVCGDALRIQQMITNILSNAIKYTPDGGSITFSLAERPTAHKGVGCYVFTVADNGVGMTEEFQKVLFEPFTRADDKRTSKIQGTGLGMAITRNIVNMMNGTIKVESAPGKGSTFTVTVFLKLQEAEAVDNEILADLPVLVVDDDAVCRESTVTMLEEIGIDGEAAASGPEAVERTVERHQRQQDYFAVLVDWKMPGMDGIETTRAIRQQVGRDVPIIVLTAYDYAEIEEEARKAGVDDFIAKPLFRSRLTAALKNLVEGRPIQPAHDGLEHLTQNDYHDKHILLVEDNALNREIAQELIGMTGANVEVAENGQEAVDAFAAAPAGHFDLIFMDIQMPLMNGYEAAAAIRSTRKGLRVPIVAMTANAFAEDVILAKNAGMNEHLAKPLDLHKLNDVLKRWL